MDHHMIITVGLDFHRHHHFAPRCELNGITYQVQEDLAKPAGIANQILGNLRGHGAGKLQTLVGGTEGKSLQRVAEALGQFELNGVQSDLTRLNFREVQDVVDNGQQRVGGGLEHGEILRLFRREWGGDEQLTHSQDAIQGSPNLVAHVCQELAFRLACHFGPDLGLGEILKCPGQFCGAPLLLVASGFQLSRVTFQLFLCVHPLGDVAADAHQTADASMCVPERDFARGKPTRLAVRRAETLHPADQRQAGLNDLFFILKELLGVVGSERSRSPSCRSPGWGRTTPARRREPG